ncbi:hypothetical protein [Streptomyces sp. NPDC006309]|uniref:hypothetical protein n=1 Tax=Streptomyces sp. NPDC006309 TaxID=3156749 RepID=UPI0033AD20D2
MTRETGRTRAAHEEDRRGAEPARDQPGGEPARNRPGGEPARNQPGGEPAEAGPERPAPGPVRRTDTSGARDTGDTPGPADRAAPPD